MLCNHAILPSTTFCSETGLFERTPRTNARAELQNPAVGTGISHSQTFGSSLSLWHYALRPFCFRRAQLGVQILTVVTDFLEGRTFGPSFVTLPSSLPPEGHAGVQILTVVTDVLEGQTFGPSFVTLPSSLPL